MEELLKLRKSEKQGLIKSSLIETRPNATQIRYAKSHGEIDYTIRTIAREQNAILIASDKTQHLAARAEGIKSIYIKPKEKQELLGFEEFFNDGYIISLHIKENMNVLIKRVYLVIGT